MEWLDSLEPLVNFLVIAMKTAGLILYIGGTIWVFVDAQKMRNRSEVKKGLHQGVWLILCLFFFIIAFPIYWINRKPRNIWKSIGIIVLLWVIPVSIGGLQGYFMGQREALQSTLREQLESVIKPGIKRNEVEFVFSEIKDIVAGPIVDTTAIYGVDSLQSIKADLWIYKIDDDFGMLWFDAKAETLLAFDFISEKDTGTLKGE